MAEAPAPLRVPFYRPDVGEEEVAAVAASLRSGWLTTGPLVREFETAFAAAVGAPHAVALNSCTAALHLGIEALGLSPGDAVLVPAMTFAATAEVVGYGGGVPVLVDCDPRTALVDVADAARKLELLSAGRLPVSARRAAGIVPVHYGGAMADLGALRTLAERHGLWIVEDAAHSFPAAWRPPGSPDLLRCGEGGGDVTCFSFYANKTITTGEGGMAVTRDATLAERIRLMSLHGLSRDAWDRFAGGASWDYRIIAAGFKYNLTDLAAAIGLVQLRRAESMRRKREEIARRFLAALADVEELDLPVAPDDGVHAWHLFPVRLRLDRLTVSRHVFVAALRAEGIGFSVHYRPLHLHPLYEEKGWTPSLLPGATELWKRTVSLPLYSVMTGEEEEAVVTAVRGLCGRFARRA